MSDQDDNNTGDQNQQQENAGPSPSPGRAEARRAQANARLAQAVLEQVTNNVDVAGVQRAREEEPGPRTPVPPRQPQQRRPREQAEPEEEEAEPQPRPPAVVPPARRDIIQPNLPGPGEPGYVPGAAAAAAAREAAAAPAAAQAPAPPAPGKRAKVPIRQVVALGQNVPNNNRVPDNIPIMGNGRPAQNKVWQITGWEDEPLWSKEKEEYARRHGLPLPRTIVFQPELCPTIGRHHWQGVVAFEERLNARQVRQALQLEKKGSAWLGTNNGDFANIVKYTMKKESRNPDQTKWFAPDKPVHIYGELPAPNAASGWNNMILSLQAGKTIQEIVEQHTGDFIRYGRGIQLAHELLNKPADIRRNVKVYLLQGLTGAGKTWAVMSMYGAKAFKKPRNKPGEVGFFCNYDGEDVLILDEFRGDIPIADLLEMLDVWPYKVPVKHQQSKYARWTKVFIMTNLMYDKWPYRTTVDAQTLAALDRRIPPQNRFNIMSREDSASFIEWYKKREGLETHLQHLVNAVPHMMSEERDDPTIVRGQNIARALNITVKSD